MKPLTVCVLIYGDHMQLIQRCLDSIVRKCDPSCIDTLRVGLNEPSSRVKKFVQEMLGGQPFPVWIYREPKNRNVLKYPLMRRMLYDPERPVQTEFVMWWDDDSCLVDEKDWWRRALRAAGEADMIGHLWKIQMQGNQYLAVQEQPWYTGKPVQPKHWMKFATGGWWIARTEVLHKWNYPFPDLKHNGGDSMLGELLRQQDLRLKDFHEGVWINADTNGRMSKAPRRGVSQKNLWYNWRPDQRPDYRHHEFDVQVYKLKGQRSSRPDR